MKRLFIIQVASLLAVFALLLASPAIAQNKPTQVEEVTIVGNFTPKVADANKITKSPVLKDTSISLPPMSYGIISSPVSFSYPISDIQPAKPKPQPDPIFGRNYLRLGFGNYTTPYVEFFAGKTQSKTAAFDIHFKHLSSKGDISDYYESGFSQNDLNINAKILSKKYAISFGGDYSRNSFQYYGFKPDQFITLHVPAADSLKQITNLFTLKTRFESLKGAAKLHHAFGAEVNYMIDHYDASELLINLDGMLDAEVSVLDGSISQTVGLGLNFKNLNNQWEIYDSKSRMLFELNPYYNAEFNEYSLHIGAKIFMADDSTSSIYFAPDIRASINAISGVLRLYAGLTGEIHTNSLKDLYGVNPYLFTTDHLLFSRNLFDFYGGVNASLSKFIDLNSWIVVGTIENKAQYYHPYQTVPYNRIMLLYDDVKRIRLNAEVTYQQKDKFRMVAGLAWQTGTPDRLSEVWYFPSIEGWLNGQVNLFPNFIAKASLKYFSQMKALYYYSQVENNITTISSELKKIDGYADLSLGAEYRLTPKFSLFLDINNVFGSNYEYWYNYPHYGINVIGGLTFAF